MWKETDGRVPSVSNLLPTIMVERLLEIITKNFLKQELFGLWCRRTWVQIFLINNINKFVAYNLNQNSLINSINNKLYSESSFQHGNSKIISAKNPVVIFGQSALKLNSSGYLFEGMKKFLSENNWISTIKEFKA